MHVMPIYFLLSIEVARVKDLRDAVSQLGVAGTAVDREYVLVRLKESALSNTNRFSTAGKEKGKGLLKLWPPVGLGTEKPRVPEKAALPIIRQHQSW